MSGTAVLASDRSEGVLTLTLDRPRALNALDEELKTALIDALEEAAADEEVRAVALTGSGRAFCVGQDLRELESGYRAGSAPDLSSTLERHYAPVIRLLTGMGKPTVALVNGIAAGAGASLAYACDLRLASDAASFTLAFTGIGLVPDAGSTRHLPQLVGLSRALGMALLNDTVDADEALRIGLVHRVIPAASFADKAAAIVTRLAAGATIAFAETKALMRANAGADLDSALAAEGAAQRRAGQTADHMEGVTAFLEKRPPRFTGA